MITNDNPIQCPEADVLGRIDTARSFVRQVLTLDASKGAVVGVLGPWGAGKTSFINLARAEFQSSEIHVLDFNPWVFSGAEQLVEKFFAELSAELKIRDLAELGETLEEYGAVFSGKPGVFFRITGKYLSRKHGGLARRREEVEDVLEKLEQPIIVVIDDVDRLEPSEIRDIFKLVRLTASFPNLIYIVVCDRFRVEQVLGEQGFEGRDYLEKILQLPFDLPKVPHHILRKQTLAATEGALANVQNPGPFDERIWPDIYEEIISPLIRNMRDVRRYTATIQFTLVCLDGKIACIDVLALEAVRIFLPDVFKLIPSAIDGLTVMSRSREVERRFDKMRRSSTSDPIVEFNNSLQTQIDRLIEVTENSRNGESDSMKEVVEAMIERLFPIAHHRRISEGDNEPLLNEEEAEQLSGCRVSHEEILRLYLEHAHGTGLLAFYDAERALARMVDHDELDEFLRSLDPRQLEEVIHYLGDLRDRFSPEHVEPGITVLLNLLPDMWQHSQDLFDSILRAVMRVIMNLLDTPEPVSVIEPMVRRILPEVTTLSSKFEFMSRIGRQANIDHRFIPQESAVELKERLREEIRSASLDSFSREYSLGKVLGFAKGTDDQTEIPFELDSSPKLTFLLLRNTSGVTTSGVLGSRVVERSTGLDWDFLAKLYGGESILITRIEELNILFRNLQPWIESIGVAFPDAEHLLEIAMKRVSGESSGDV